MKNMTKKKKKKLEDYSYRKIGCPECSNNKFQLFYCYDSDDKMHLLSVCEYCGRISLDKKGIKDEQKNKANE